MNAARINSVLSYDRDTGILVWLPRDGQPAWNAKNSGKEAGSIDVATGYRKVSIDGKTYFAHRVAWLIEHNETPDQVDHINGVRLDNRMSNLRAVSVAENNRNLSLRSDNKSGVVGVEVCSSTGLWRATIRYEGKTRHLGRFRLMTDAIKARKAAEQSFGFHPNHGRLSAAKSKAQGRQ